MILAMNLSFVMEAGAGQVAADGLTSEILEDEKLSTAHGQQFSVCCSLRSLRRRNYSQNAAEDCGLSLYMFIMRIAGWRVGWRSRGDDILHSCSSCL